MEITNINQLDFTKQYTYADYLAWEIEDVRLEILDGLVKQLETPWIRHHVILNKFFFEMYQYFKKEKHFEAWRIPFHLYLTNDKNAAPNKIKNVVQPDIFVCKKELRGNYGVTGVPELIVEIYRANRFQTCLRGSSRDVWINTMRHFPRFYLRFAAGF